MIPEPLPPTACVVVGCFNHAALLAAVRALVPLDRQVVWYRQHPTNISRQDPSDMAFYHERVKWKAWASAENTPAQRGTVGHVWRRLRSRWVLSCLLALVSRLRRGRLSAARRAGRAVAVFGRDVVLGHPREPDRRTGALIAEFIAAHQAGRGFHSPENWHANLSCSGGDPAGNGRRPGSRSAARRR